jgi:hypothetical protein
MSELQSVSENFQNSPYFWDWITLACLAVSVLGFMIFLVWLLGLPGRIAVARNHPDADAVYTMGWVGFLAIVPWIQALIWAFKPTDKVDIRRFPDEERIAEREELRRLAAYAYGEKAAAALEKEPPTAVEKASSVKAAEAATASQDQEEESTSNGIAEPSAKTGPES